MKALWCISGLGRGHAARCRPLIEALAARGHECVAATPGLRAATVLDGVCPVITPGPEFREKVAPAPRQDVAFVAIWDAEMSVSFYQRDLAASTLRSAEFLAAAFAETRPDLVVVDQIVPAAQLGEMHGVPVVQVTHGPIMRGRRPWAYWLEERPAAIRYPAAREPINRALGAVGAAPIERIDEIWDGDLLVVPTPPSLGSHPKAMHIDLPTTLPAAAREIALPPAERPRVALFLGRAPHAREEAIDAVLASGSDAVVLESTGAPARERVVDLPAVDPALVLPHVTAAIHHGGSGSIVTCLQHGVPSIAVPTQGEQEFNAHMLEDIGAGLHVPVSDEPLEEIRLSPEVTTVGHRRAHNLAERLAEALPRLDAGPARREQAVIEKLPGPADAAAAIEALL